MQSNDPSRRSPHSPSREQETTPIEVSAEKILELMATCPWISSQEHELAVELLPTMNAEERLEYFLELRKAAREENGGS